MQVRITVSKWCRNPHLHLLKIIKTEDTVSGWNFMNCIPVINRKTSGCKYFC